MATYAQAIQWVRKRHRKSVSSCWIAHVRQLNGLPVNRAWNRRPGPQRQNPCPDWARPLIEEAFGAYGLI